jgi:hypothetical protein
MKWRITDGLLALMFLLFAALQYNDPDPGLWMLVYGSIFGVCLAAAFNRFSLGLMIPMAGGYLILSAMHVEGMLEWLRSPNRKMIFDDLAKMQYPYIEEAREFLGLLMCVATLLYLFYRQRAFTKKTAKAETVHHS